MSLLWWAVGGLTGAAAFKASRSSKGELTPDREMVLKNALNMRLSSEDYNKLADRFDEMGLSEEAILLRKRAKLADETPEKKAQYKQILKDAFLSTNTVSVRKLSDLFEKKGAVGTAEKLRAYADGLETMQKAPKPQVTADTASAANPETANTDASHAAGETTMGGSAVRRIQPSGKAQTLGRIQPAKRTVQISTSVHPPVSATSAPVHITQPTSDPIHIAAHPENAAPDAGSHPQVIDPIHIAPTPVQSPSPSGGGGGGGVVSGTTGAVDRGPPSVPTPDSGGDAGAAMLDALPDDYDGSLDDIEADDAAIEDQLDS